MSIKAGWFTAVVLCVSMGLFASSAPAQTGQAASGSGNGSTQATQSPNGSPPDTGSSKASTKSSETPSQTLSLGDIARKLKVKDQEGQNPGPGKPKVYTNDDLLPSKTGSVQATLPNTSSTSDAPGSKASGQSANATPDDLVILKFEPQKSTIKRPGVTSIDWMIQNKSDHLAKFTLVFSVTGPCNYKEEHISGGNLGPGSGLTDNSYAVGFYESQCAGEYTVQLGVITLGGQVVASAKVNVM